jgi:hypothetical protein
VSMTLSGSDGLRIAATVFVLCAALARPVSCDSDLSLWLAESLVVDHTPWIDGALERRALLAPSRMGVAGFPKPDPLRRAPGDGYVNDVAWRNGHFYPGRVYGLGLLIVPWYALTVRPLLMFFPVGTAWTDLRDGVSVLWLTLTLSALASAACALMVHRFHLRRGLSKHTAVLFTLTYSLGTLGFFYGTTLSTWPIINLLTWLILVLLSAPDTGQRSMAGYVGLGILGGTMVTLHTLGGLVVAVFAGYVLVSFGGRRLVAFVGGAVAGALPVLIYQCVAFGNALHMGASFIVGPWKDVRAYGWFGFGTISLAVVGKLLFSWSRGLLPLMPVVVLGLGARPRPDTKSLFWLGVAGFLTFFVANSARPLDWYAGEGFWGPRYLVPGLPFLWLLIVEGWQRWKGAVAAGIAALSIFVNAIGAQFGDSWTLPAGVGFFLASGPRFPVLGWLHEILAQHTQGRTHVSSLGLLIVTTTLLSLIWMHWRAATQSSQGAAGKPGGP